MSCAVVRAGEARKRRAESERKRERAARRISGGNGKRDPPVPIPNTVVKPLYVESTWLEAVWEDR